MAYSVKSNKNELNDISANVFPYPLTILFAFFKNYPQISYGKSLGIGNEG